MPKTKYNRSQIKNNKVIDYVFPTIFIVLGVIFGFILSISTFDSFVTREEDIIDVKETIISIWDNGLNVECENLDIHAEKVNIESLSTKSLAAPENKDIGFSFKVNNLFVERVGTSIFVSQSSGINRFKFDFSKGELEIENKPNYIVGFVWIGLSFCMGFFISMVCLFVIAFFMDAYSIFIKKERKTFDFIDYLCS